MTHSSRLDQPVAVTYSQKADSLQDDQDDLQKLIVETVDAGSGSYIILSTNRWAFDSTGEIDQLAAILKRQLAVEDPWATK